MSMVPIRWGDVQIVVPCIDFGRDRLDSPIAKNAKRIKS